MHIKHKRNAPSFDIKAIHPQNAPTWTCPNYFLFWFTFWPCFIFPIKFFTLVTRNVAEVLPYFKRDVSNGNNSHIWRKWLVTTGNYPPILTVSDGGLIHCTRAPGM